MPDAEEPIVYEVRLTEPAETEVEAAYFHRMRYGLPNAEDWYAGLGRALEGLSLFPRRFVLAPESDALGGGVHQMIYGKGQNAYRVLYRIIEPHEDEPGVVRVLHVRHVSRRHQREED